jgi:hypothetical protein
LIPPPAPVSWKPSRKAVAGFLTAGLAVVTSIVTLSGAHSLSVGTGLVAVLGPLVPAVTYYLVPPPG